MTKRKEIRLKIFALLVIVLLILSPFAKARLGVLARPPDWNQLDKYQRTITREKFGELMRKYYAPNGAAYGFVWIDRDHALIRREHGQSGFYRLDFAKNDTLRREVPAVWRPIIPGALSGRKIALDPGHLGGEWAKMEERWYQIGDSQPVTEGDMTLLVAKKIAVKLRMAGAIVSFLRETASPLTSLRPDQLADEAVRSLKDRNAGFSHSSSSVQTGQDLSVQKEAERLFYRLGEIRERAVLNNNTLQPDLTICIHFNAMAWNDPLQPTFVVENHLHLLVNGQYANRELSYDDVRFEMLEKLLGQSLKTELSLSKIVASRLAAATGLPPYIYTTPNAGKIADSPYVWTRNLLATRLYHNPTLYLEPYVMNNQEVFDRIQLGDYEGTREINGVKRKSIYNEYADAVVEALTVSKKN